MCLRRGFAAYLALLLVVTGCLTRPVFGQTAPSSVDEAALAAFPHRPDRLILERRTGLSASRAAELGQLHQSLGARTTKRYPDLNDLEVVELPAGANLEQALASYKASGLVAKVHRDYLRRISVTPNDTDYLNGRLWGLHNTGQLSGINDADIDAPEAWDIRNSASSVIVAVIDTGVRTTHEDLAANMWRNPGESGNGRENNGIDDDGNGYIDDVFGINARTGSGNPTDDNGHGSHCAGTIGAVGNNGVGITGVAWSVKIMALKFLSATGEGADSDAIECIDYARRKGAHILSNSWGGGPGSSALETAIGATRTAGLIFVAAAGNEASDNDRVASFPANFDFDNIVSVAAVDRRDQLATFSNYGANKVDLAAPGVEIRSTWFTSDSAYQSISGTSMATPHVAGAFALLKAQFPGDSAQQLINRMLAATDPLSSLARKCRTGGRLNLARALGGAVVAPPNDAFANRIVLPSSNTTAGVFSGNASREAGEPTHAGRTGSKSVWWSWTAPAAGLTQVSTLGSDYDTLLAVYTGTTINGLTLIGSNDNVSATDLTSRVQFNAVAGQTYVIAVDGPGGATSLTVSQSVANDAFAARTVLLGDNFRILTNNAGATEELGEPLHAGQRGGRSLWWQWTAPFSGRVMISTSGSDTVDTLLAVYTGTNLSTLREVASDDDSGPSGLTAELFFTASAGTTYHIAVDGYQGDFGDIVLTLSNRLNDSFANRKSLFGNSTTYGHTIAASRETGEPRHGDEAGNASIWYAWTAPYSGPAYVSTYGSDFDTLLGVYTGLSLSTLSVVGQNDDEGGSLTSQVTFSAVAGVTYLIAVDGYDDESGMVTLTAFVEPPPPGTPVSGAAPVRLTNLSVRTVAGSGAQTLIMGFSTGGLGATSANKPLLLRAIGPTLASFGVTGVLSDPQAELFRVPTSIGSNDNWGGTAALVAANASVGAFALPAASRDSALAPSLSPGGYTLNVTGVGGTTGVALAEIYDLTPTADFRTDTPRLINASARSQVGTGSEILIAGFTLSGQGTRTILVRAIGPTLGKFGVVGALEDPVLRIFQGSVPLAENDDWARSANAAQIAEAAGRVGAFALATAELDSSILITLPAGSYTAQISGFDNVTGVSLVELYEVP
ncbi:MAG: S8 family peptidase [Opitutaceae bacterium]